VLLQQQLAALHTWNRKNEAAAARTLLMRLVAAPAVAVEEGKQRWHW
jgi:hypothetical protein